MAHTSTFAVLPTELQLTIWGHAIASSSISPRVHSILPSKRNPSTFISNQSIPSLLHTCSISRVIYLSTITPTYAYATYINFSIDTLYLANCPTPASGVEDSDGFEVVKELGRNEILKGKVKSLAVDESFWLRPNTVSKSIAVDAWNVIVKSGLGGGLEELIVVFPPRTPTLDVHRSKLSVGDASQIIVVNEKRELGRKERMEQSREARFWTIGWFQMERDLVGEMAEVDERARRCDRFLRAYLGYFPGEGRWMKPAIKYVALNDLE